MSRPKGSKNKTKVDISEQVFPDVGELNESQNQMLSKLQEVLPDITKESTPNQILEGLAVKLNAKAFSSVLKTNQMDREIKAHQVAAAYASLYTKVTNVRIEMIRDVERNRFFWLIDVLLSQLTEDSLAPEISTGEILEVSSENPAIQEELDFLDEKFSFDQLVLNITPDLLGFGEYILKTEIRPVDSILQQQDPDEDPEENKSGNKTNKQKLHASNAMKMVKGGKGALNEENKKQLEQFEDDIGEGLVGLHDIVEQGTVIALQKDNNVSGYLWKDENNKIQRAEPADFVRFALDSQRIRVDLAREFDVSSRSVKRIFKDLPRFVRVGKSCIWPILGKLKELILLEALVPATKINKLTTGTVIGVQVPTGYSIDQALEASKKVENIVNKKVSVDPRLGEINIENIMSAAGKMKVVPLFGEKGQLERLDFKSDEPDELLSSIADIRRVILSSVGIPYELVFGSEGESKGEILKRYARYLRKLKNIQRAVQEGIRQIVYIHLANKDIDFIPDDVQVEFRNKLVEIDNLDRLEFMDTTVGMLNNITEFIFTLAGEESPLAGRINLEALVDFLNSQLEVIGLGEVIVTAEEAKKLGIEVDQLGNVIPSDDDDDETPSPDDENPNEVPDDETPPNDEPEPITVEPDGSGENL